MCILSMKSEYFVLSISEWYLLFFAKLRSYRVKNQKVMMENFSHAAKCSSINDGATLSLSIYHVGNNKDIG